MSNATTFCHTEINSNFDPTPLEGETFLPVPGYEGLYEVSDFGRVVSHKGLKPRVLKGRVITGGHIQVALSRGGKKKYLLVHRLVALAHLGPVPADKPNVLHANDIPTDNRLVNLRYGTQGDNMRDRVLNGYNLHARTTHCPLGHLYIASNTYVCANGKRSCIACNRARSAAHYAAKIGRTFDVNEDADRRYIKLTTAPGADLSPVDSLSLAQAANPRQAKNMRDKVNNDGSPKVNRTSCPRGHEYVVANTYDYANGRICIACQRARAAARYAAKIGRDFNVNEDADRRYIELTTAPGADMTPVLSQILAVAANLRHGTQADNMRDRVLNGGDHNASASRCKRGHLFVVANTHVEAGGNRKCIACKRSRNASYRAKEAGRAFNVNEDADRRYIEITTAPGADMTPALSPTLAQAANDSVAA